MNDIIIKNEKIESLIYEVRGKQVMLDSDLAKLYKCVNGTKSINLAVNRNIERFPADFYFQLTKLEYSNLKFQFETSSLNTYGGVRKIPYVLTKQDIDKYNKQYNNLKVMYDNTFHDRYFIIDNEILYHCGASINRIGYKTFSINLVTDKSMLELLLNKIKTIQRK